MFMGLYGIINLCSALRERTWDQHMQCTSFSMWQAFKILKDIPTYHKLEQITCVGFVITLGVISKVLSCFPLRDCFRLFLLESTSILSYNIVFGVPECKVLPWMILWWERKIYSGWKLPVSQYLKTYIAMICYEFSRNSLCKKKNHWNLPFVEVELSYFQHSLLLCSSQDNMPPQAGECLWVSSL